MPMQPKILGRSGLRVSELCLGTMTFGGQDASGADKAESRKILDTYLDAGGNFVDTAVNYTGGRSEEILGELIEDRRDELVVATKYTGPVRQGDPNAIGNQRKNLVQSLEASLRRLRTDYIDLYWVHLWDNVTPVEEIMRALDDQVRAGKVLYVGISNTPAWVVSRANTLAELRGWTPFIGLQVEYNLAERTVERDLAPMAAALGLGILAWGPLSGGLLTGKYRRDGKAADATRLDSEDRRMTDRNLEIAEKLVEVAGEVGATPAQVALAWLRRRPGATVIPILGARTADQLSQTLGCLDVELSADALRRLDEISAISLGYPYDFLRAIAGRYARATG